jgi:hypothetical protein
MSSLSCLRLPVRLAVCSATGPTSCDNLPNSLPGFTWTNCASGIAAVQSTCTGGCAANYAASGSVSTRCSKKGVYEVTGQCTGGRECSCLSRAAAAAAHKCHCAAHLPGQRTAWPRAHVCAPCLQCISSGVRCSCVLLMCLYLTPAACNTHADLC